MKNYLICYEMLLPIRGKYQYLLFNNYEYAKEKCMRFKELIDSKTREMNVQGR